MRLWSRSNTITRFTCYQQSWNLSYIICPMDTCAGDGQLDISLAHEMKTEEKGQEFLDYYVRLIEKCVDADTEITRQELLTSIEQ